VPQIKVAISVAFSPDGKRGLSAGGSDGLLKLWDIETGRVLRSFSDTERLWPVAFSPDGTRVTSGAKDGRVSLWDAASGRLVRTFAAHTDWVTTIAFSRDGSRMLTGSLDKTVKLWEPSTGRLRCTLSGQSDDVRSAVFARGGRWVVSGHSDGVVRIWDTAGCRRLASLIATPDGTWIAITPEGFFAGSPKGGEMLNVVRGLDVFTIGQFYQALYRPDLVREKLAGDPRGLVRQAAASLDLERVLASGEAPDVRVTLPGRALNATGANGRASIEAEITSRGGGIGRIEWRVNGVTVGIDDPPAGAGQIVRLSRDLALDSANNEVSVVAYNSANLVASMAVSISVTAQSVASPTPGQGPSVATAAAVEAERPRLFVLAAGVNDYADKRIALQNAVSDASEVARAFKAAAGGLYRSVDIKLMTDADVVRDKLDVAFKEIGGKAKATDVFVLYLAGHGKTIDGRYYFAPQDLVIDGEITDQKAIDASVLRHGISQEQLQRWFASIPARKSVILFDTCDSGTLAGEAGETQELERGSANDRLAQATGRSIITAAAGTQEAQEGYHGHGLFTYEMLDAINRADGDGNGTVEVSELAAYVYAQVTDLSLKVFKRRQAPQMKITTNFALTSQTRILQDDATPIAEAKPTYHVTQTAQLQIQPNAESAVVRSLSANTAINVIATNNGWSLVAIGGKLIGYIAARDLAPIASNK
jgi:uncharacterized caspase-like protein